MTMTRLEAVLATIDAQANASLEKLNQAEAFAQRSENLSVEGSSRDEVATVCVDGTGQVTSIALVEDLSRHRGSAVAAAVLEALGQAQRRLSFRVEELGKEIYGEDSPSVSAFSQAYRDKFGYEEDDSE